MRKLARKKAFSLVELAIVTIITGILISIALQATNMIRSFKMMGARAQTKSSAVNGIQGIVAWYDSTAEKSFLKRENQDGSSISVWNDINSQSVIPNTATQENAVNRPTFIFDNTIANGLPILRFDGNDYFNLPDGTIPFSDYDYSFFIVSRANSVSESYGIIGSGDYDTEKGSNIIRYLAGGLIENSWQRNSLISSSIAVSAGKMQIFSFIYDRNLGRQMYVNGNLVGEDNVTERFGLQTNNTIGKVSIFGVPDSCLKGDIAEIILFGRDVTKDERQAVEKYLAKKWTITF